MEKQLRWVRRVSYRGAVSYIWNVSKRQMEGGRASPQQIALTNHRSTSIADIIIESMQIQ